MTASPPFDKLFQRVTEATDDLVALTQDLIRIPTVNPPGDAYGDCCAYLDRRLSARGFAVQHLRAEGARGDSDAYPRTNVIARYETGRPGPCVHFNSHIDVVEPGAGWTHDPFAAETADGRIYGRGACDMKGGLAASIVAAEALIEAVPDLPGTIEISGTVDEESGGYAGVAWLAERGYFSKPRVDHVLIPEPLYKNCVCLGHRGVWWGEIEMRGRIAHGSMPFLGTSAIRGMADFLARVENELFPALNQRRTAMPVIPEEARQSTLNVNSLHGGSPEEAPGSDRLPAALVADSCRVVLDRRYLMEENRAEVVGEIRALLDKTKASFPGIEYEIREMWSVDPTMTDPAAPVVAVVSAEIERVLGAPAQHVASPGTYDQKHIARLGQLKDCIAYGPGILELAHQPDEYIVIEDMVQSAKVMAAATWRLLNGDIGAPPADPGF